MKTMMTHCFSSGIKNPMGQRRARRLMSRVDLAQLLAGLHIYLICGVFKCAKSPCPLIRGSGALPVRPEAIILGPVVEPHVQPRHPGPGGAEPDRLGPDPPRHRLADRLPKGVPL